MTKSTSIEPQDTGLELVANPPCWASTTAVSRNLTIPAKGVSRVAVVQEPLHRGRGSATPPVPGRSKRKSWLKLIRVRIGRDDPAHSGIDRQRTAHDRSRRDRGHQLSIALGGQRRLRGSDSLVEPGARGGERRVALHDFGVRVEVGVESFRSERPLDKPTDGVCGVGHLLRGGHHARRGPHAGVLLRQAPCGAVEELPRAIELGQGLLCEWHGRSSDAERRDLRTTAATRQCGVGAQPFGGDEAAVGSLATVTAAGTCLGAQLHCGLSVSRDSACRASDHLAIGDPERRQGVQDRAPPPHLDSLGRQSPRSPR